MQPYKNFAEIKLSKTIKKYNKNQAISYQRISNKDRFLTKHSTPAISI